MNYYDEIVRLSDELAPIFKVGDMVQVVKLLPDTVDATSGIKIGDKYKIIEVDTVNDGRFLINFHGSYPMLAHQLRLVKEKKMKDLCIVYKVVRLDGLGGYQSCLMTDERKLQYQLESRTKAPKNAPIFVFSSWLHAKDFSKDGDVVLKCVGKVVDGDRFGYGAWIVPTGTLFCSWVFPIEVA